MYNPSQLYIQNYATKQDKLQLLILHRAPSNACSLGSVIPLCCLHCRPAHETKQCMYVQYWLMCCVRSVALATEAYVAVLRCTRMSCASTPTLTSPLCACPYMAGLARCISSLPLSRAACSLCPSSRWPIMAPGPAAPAAGHVLRSHSGLCGPVRGRKQSSLL
jgi:hypothetical protein